MGLISAHSNVVSDLEWSNVVRVGSEYVYTVVTNQPYTEPRTPGMDSCCLFPLFFPPFDV